MTNPIKWGDKIEVMDCGKLSTVISFSGYVSRAIFLFLRLFQMYLRMYIGMYVRIQVGTTLLSFFSMNLESTGTVRYGTVTNIIFRFEIE